MRLPKVSSLLTKLRFVHSHYTSPGSGPIIPVSLSGSLQKKSRVIQRCTPFVYLRLILKPADMNLFDYAMASCPTVYDHFPSAFF